MSSTELKSLKRWRALAIVSTGLLLACLVYNIFQPHSRSGNGHIPYIYCMFNQNIPFCCKISNAEHLFPAPAGDAISYEIKVFHSNFNEDRTRY